MEDEHRALLLGELVEEPAEGRDPRASGRVLVGREAAIGLVIVLRLASEHRAAAGGAPHHEHHVHRHAVKPGGELRLAAELGEAFVDLEEDLLHHVLGVSRGAEHPEHEARYVATVTPEQLGEGDAITLLRATDELVHVRRVARGRLCHGHQPIDPRGRGRGRSAFQKPENRTGPRLTRNDDPRRTIPRREVVR